MTSQKLPPSSNGGNDQNNGVACLTSGYISQLSYSTDLCVENQRYFRPQPNLHYRIMFVGSGNASLPFKLRKHTFLYQSLSFLWNIIGKVYWPKKWWWLYLRQIKGFYDILCWSFAIRCLTLTGCYLQPGRINICLVKQLFFFLISPWRWKTGLINNS